MISKRLRAIADYVVQEDFAADIGCDHGQLAIYLFRNKITTNIVASDVNPNALENAIKNFRKANLEKYIPAILSNGLQNIDLIKVNTIIISGMGTHTILEILNDDAKLKNIKKLIIQSNNNLTFLREEIIKKGFYIDDEKIVFEKNIYYTIILFLKGKSENIDYDLGIVKSENKSYYLQLLNDWQQIKKQIPFTKWSQKRGIKTKIKKIKKVISKL